MDAVTEDTREFDEDEEEEEEIIAACCVVIVICTVGLASVSRVNNGRIGRVEGTAARYGSTPGWTRTPRWPDRWGARKWLLDWKCSIWWETIERLTENATAHPQLLKQFKAKTRVPWTVFQELLQEMSTDLDMQERKHVSIPLSLKLCAALRYLATGHSFDGMEDGFRMSAQVQRDFFWEKFLPWMMKNKYDETVRAPRSHDELAATVHEYEEVGFPGCCGSVDGTHVAWYGFRAGQRSDYTGKEGYPTIVFGVTVDHKYKIMHVTRAHPGTTNDSLVMLEDEFHSQTMASDLYQNFEFDMYDADGEKVRQTGVYTLCDGGYGAARNLVCAFKNCGVRGPKLDWTRWLGSVRKDSECTFGIMKARFQVLYTRLKRRNANDIERLFKVCAVLHNMVLAYDPVGARPRDFEMYMHHLQAERELDDQADLSLEDTPRLSVDNPASLRRARNVPVAAQNESHAEDAPARSRLKRKRDLQEALITHFQHFKKMHKRQYGVEPFAYARTRDKHLAMLAGF
jgi:hypothetical protein